jgi:Tol biopolymer transport system component
MTGQTTGEGQPVTAAGMDAIQPSLSRDGKKLVFRAQREGKNELWQTSLETGLNTLLAADDSLSVRGALTWSHDGTHLAYAREHPISHERSVVLLRPGGEEQALTSPHAGECGPEDWSADGARILIVRSAGPGPRAIWLLPVDAAPKAEAQARLLASKPDCNLFQPRFSPDERWICFLAVQRNDTAVRMIYVMPAAGGDWIPITEGKYRDDKPRWSPDGKRLYFMSTRRGFFDLWGIGFDPHDGKKVGKPFLVKAFDNPGQRVLQFGGLMELALSEQRFVLPITQVSGNIWVLENVDR